MMRSLLGILAAVACAGCGGSHGSGGEHEHAHGEHEHGEHAQEGHGAEAADDHGHGHEGASESVTIWGATTQLFVEFSALVVGEESAFAAHLTRLADHGAVDTGTVVVELSGAGGPTERFSVEAPLVPGIFRPVARPTAAGRRKVTVRLTSPTLSETFELGEFSVFATRAEAEAAAAPEAEDGTEISFLLEQQWPIPFGITQVEVRPLRPTVPAFATLTLPPQAETVLTAPREGRVLAVEGGLLAVGAEVAAGAVVAALSSAAGGGEDLASLDLAVEQAAIRGQAAQRELSRVRPLVEQGVVAARRLDEAKAAAAQAQAELRSARRRRDSRGQSQRVAGRADTLDLPSPLSGVVAEVYVASGAWVAEGQPIARIVDVTKLWLDVGVPEAYVGRLGAVSGAWYELAGFPEPFEVGADALVSVGTGLDPRTRALPVRFWVDNPDRKLRAGMSTLAHLITAPPEARPAVPVSALVDDAGVDVVYAQTGGESFVRRVVRLGVRDGASVEVLSGVAPGEWVVSRGAYSVKLASTATESIGHGHAH